MKNTVRNKIVFSLLLLLTPACHSAVYHYTSSTLTIKPYRRPDYPDKSK